MNSLDAVQNDLDLPTGQRERKAYATLASQFALVGVELIKGDPEVIGQTPYYATRYGVWKPLESLDAARAYLAKCTKAGRGQELQAQ
ncbi:hypothetical protein [Polaromonas sp.]|uniref:hypothetical protein n=1 Tax=Polaromonas sp. TaxID=1869339 RepID=UPI00181B2BB8|nr:hypothetical protein [Polaromonas sp.]NML85605.1 hypothetical protein [Polaromonas sp.]